MGGGRNYILEKKESQKALLRRPKKGEKVWSEMWKKTSLGRGNNKNKSPEVVEYMHKEKRGSQLC